MNEFIIKNMSEQARKPCFQIHAADTDEMICWCVSLEDARQYVTGTLRGHLRSSYSPELQEEKARRQPTK